MPGSYDGVSCRARLGRLGVVSPYPRFSHSSSDQRTHRLLQAPRLRISVPTADLSPYSVFELTINSTAYKEDLYSCGGCSTLGTGTDCSALPGARGVECSAGKCIGELPYKTP